ncbi:MAG: PEP-utilizing enzyme [Armatimonadetes bacterium]|nr:PEP-utilizing enzyme [Armatimonadota bacterium]MDW8153550.1 PEP-utilizing enzyme [Armatimonadota bacterium]
MAEPMRFPSPFEVEAPPGAEDWHEMYPPYVRFTPERRAEDEARLWFYNGMHFPEPVAPFDLLVPEIWYIAIGEMNSRLFCIPPAMGVDFRVLNGYVYISSVSVTDPQKIQERAQLFNERAGYYYANWRTLYEEWKQKVIGEVRILQEIRFPDLPEVEPKEWVFNRRGLGTSYDLFRAWTQFLESANRAAQYHMEVVMIGFAAYLTFYDFCKRAFPEISDQDVTRMIGAIEVSMFRPQDELRRLAQRAVELGIAPVFQGRTSAQEVFRALEQSPEGRAWLEEWKRSSDPWFYVNTGSGMQHQHRAWVDDPSPAVDALRVLVGKIQRGEPVDRDSEAVRRERDEITRGYRELLATEQDRQAFDQLLALTRDVYYSIEDHKFWVDHWYQSVFWNKVRELGRVFAQQGFLQDPEDIFYLHHTEVYQGLVDLLIGWSVGAPAWGPRHWPGQVAKRRRLLERLRAWSPPPALGVVPEVIGDPAVIMLWGITPDRLQVWLTPEEGKVVLGAAGSPGTAEGPARVVHSVEELHQVQPGEILVCPVTEPSWAPVFVKVQGIVTDIGGIMSHAAIVAREYRIPAVVGTGVGTKRIRTGQWVRVDGGTGTVTILGE